MASAPTPTPAASGLSNNVAGALCYAGLFITGIAFLVIEPFKNEKFVRFHAFQSIFFSLSSIVVVWLFGIVVLPLVLIGGLGLARIIVNLIQLALFLAWLFLMYKAYNNETFRLPVIGKLAAQQAGL